MLPHHDQQASQDRNQMQHVQELCPAYTSLGHVLQVQSERLFQQPQAFTLTTRLVSEMRSRVENRRSGFSLPVAVDWAFASSPQSGLA